MSIIVIVFDTVYGRPAQGIEVKVRSDFTESGGIQEHGFTDFSGRFQFPLRRNNFPAGQIYQVELDVDSYFTSISAFACYKKIAVQFRVGPLIDEQKLVTLITPFSYVTMFCEQEP